MATDLSKTLPHAWQKYALREAQELTRSGGDPMHMLTGLSRDQLRTIFQLHDKLSWGERLNAVDTSRLCALFPAVPREAVAERIAHVNAHSTPQHRVQAFVQSVVSRDAADGAAVRQAGELGAHHLHLDMVGDLSRRLDERRAKTQPVRTFYERDGRLLGTSALAPDAARARRHLADLQDRIDRREAVMNAIAARGGAYFRQTEPTQKHVARAEAAAGVLDLNRVATVAGAKDYLGSMAPTLNDTVRAAYDLSASRDHAIDQGHADESVETVAEWRGAGGTAPE